jgi:hypothetical protein
MSLARFLRPLLICDNITSDYGDREGRALNHDSYQINP